MSEFKKFIAVQEEILDEGILDKVIGYLGSKPWITGPLQRMGGWMSGSDKSDPLKQYVNKFVDKISPLTAPRASAGPLRPVFDRPAEEKPISEPVGQGVMKPYSMSDEPEVRWRQQMAQDWRALQDIIEREYFQQGRSAEEALQDERVKEFMSNYRRYGQPQDFENKIRGLFPALQQHHQEIDAKKQKEVAGMVSHFKQKYLGQKVTPQQLAKDIAVQDSLNSGRLTPEDLKKIVHSYNTSVGRRAGIQARQAAQPLTATPAKRAPRKRAARKATSYGAGQPTPQPAVQPVEWHRLLGKMIW